jgi:hypothetical protein
MITTIRYFDPQNQQILVTCDVCYHLYPESYRDAEITEWLETHTIEPWVDPEDYQAIMRGERDRRLVMSDWTQLLDVPLTPEEVEAWVVYRQALRDFPNEHPEVVDKATYDALVWPQEP